MSDLSFYSKQFGGTFHFLQFNMLNRDKFFTSEELKHLIKFIEKSFPELHKDNQDNMQKQMLMWKEFVENIQFKKTIFDIDQEIKFNSKYFRKNMH